MPPSLKSKYFRNILFTTLTWPCFSDVAYTSELNAMKSKSIINVAPQAAKFMQIKLRMTVPHYSTFRDVNLMRYSTWYKIDHIKFSTMFICLWYCTMMTSSNGNIFRVTGLLCGEFTGPRWIPRTKASDAEPWYFLWSAPWPNGWELELELFYST